MANTRTEVNEIRIERVLQYIGNPAGQTLDQLLITIDNKLKDSSPDALSPGLINWGHKDLFTDKFVRVSGTGNLTYNAFSPSKIGKGRFNIVGNGIWEYDRFIAVSDTRGATGKIYLGSTNAATVSVGVRCYDENQVYLGTNGGSFVNAVNPTPLNSYTFYKSSAFGESNSGLRFLKPNTRFVKLYIESTLNSGTVFFDESELTTFELDERYIQTFSNDLDWNTAEIFYSETPTNNTFTFKNDQDGKVRTFFVKNTGAVDINVYFPTAKWQGGVPLTLLRAGRVSAFTFIKAGGLLYASVIEELE